MALDRLVFQSPWPESAYVQELYFNQNAHYFVLELLDPTLNKSWFDHRRRKSARLLGFVGMRVEGERGHISTLALRQEWRGQQLGEILFLVALNHALRDGAKVVGLEVRVSNEIAQALYIKHGFEARSRLRRYYADGEDAYYMQVGVEDDRDFRRCIETQLADLSTERGIETVDKD
ncbi:MAG: GNAT family N-acetyltransferase [Anaerolineae bacterium]